MGASTLLRRLLHRLLLTKRDHLARATQSRDSPGKRLSLPWSATAQLLGPTSPLPPLGFGWLNCSDPHFLGYLPLRAPSHLEAKSRYGAYARQLPWVRYTARPE